VGAVELIDSDNDVEVDAKELVRYSGRAGRGSSLYKTVDGQSINGSGAVSYVSP
jgi:hypothetical protein